ncbi:MAG TPA: hypothetical protein VK348_14385, partial [Planctomycetota bacterium]|nr:hypothetical protein [Planctomycetota bacterium]
MPRNLVPLLFAATLSAQTGNLTAYPQDSTQNSGGSMVPFGASSDGRYAEGRTQMLVPAPYLPGPGAVLTALWVKCQSSVAIHYGSLQITVAPTTTAALSTTFGDNLASPVVVLPASNLTVNYTAQWTQIPFTTQYVHDGVSSLVIDVQKAVVVPFPSAVMASTGSPRRSDLPNMLYATGILGSAASVAAAATISDFT